MNTPKYGSWDRLGVANDGTDIIIRLGRVDFRLPWRQAALFVRNLQRAIDKARAVDTAFQREIKEIVSG